MYNELEKPPPMSDYEYSIHKEIIAGLPNDQDDLAKAVHILHYYNRGKPNISRDPGDDKNYPLPNTGLTRRVIELRNSLMYSPPPSRGIDGDDAANELLDKVYSDCVINDLMGKAVQMADLLGVSAVGVLPGQGASPICLYVLDASQFVLRSNADDAASPAHIIVIDKLWDGRLRYTWYSENARRVYEAKANGRWLTSGGRTTQLVEDTINPFGGRLPFALVHSELPFSGMTSEGIGEWLADEEERIAGARYHADMAYQKYTVPTTFLKNVRPDFHPTKIYGEYPRLPVDASGAADKSPEFLTDESTVDLDKLTTYIDGEIDKVLQASGVPKGLYFLESNALSGDAIEAEQRPIIDATRQKQGGLKLYEKDLASAILAVAGEVMADQTYAEKLRKASRSANLTVVWPDDLFLTPGVDQDTQDRNALDMGIQSLVDVTRRRYRLSSDEEAIKRIIKVRNDNAILAKLGVVRVDEPPPANDLRSSVVEGGEANETEE